MRADWSSLQVRGDAPAMSAICCTLRQAGLQPGASLIIVMPNITEWPIVFLGAMEFGLLVTTANPQYTAGKYTDTARTAVG